MSNVIKLWRRELPDDLITVSQFAIKHRCSKSYVYKLHNQKKIEFFPCGYNKFSEREALEAMGVYC